MIRGARCAASAAARQIATRRTHKANGAQGQRRERAEEQHRAEAAQGRLESRVRAHIRAAEYDGRHEDVPPQVEHEQRRRESREAAPDECARLEPPPREHRGARCNAEQHPVHDDGEPAQVVF